VLVLQFCPLFATLPARYFLSLADAPSQQCLLLLTRYDLHQESLLAVCSVSAACLLVIMVILTRKINHQDEIVSRLKPALDVFSASRAVLTAMQASLCIWAGQSEPTMICSQSLTVNRSTVFLFLCARGAPISGTPKRSNWISIEAAKGLEGDVVFSPYVAHGEPILEAIAHSCAMKLSATRLRR
jgi:hypothetical protein